MKLPVPLLKSTPRWTIQRKAQRKAFRPACQRALLMLSLLAAPAVGHCSISIMPMEARLPVERPGARLTNDIEVYNSGEEPIHVVSSIQDWSMTLSGQKRFHPGGTQPLSCATWIQLNPVEFNLAPGKSMRVRYSIAPPTGMAQEHRAMIFFTSRAVPRAGDSRLALNVQTRIGCKVLVTPPLKSPLQGQITGMALQTLAAPAPASVGAPWVHLDSTAAAPAPSLLSRVKITFVNPNPVSVRLNGTVEARNADGQVVARGEIAPAKALVLVGATRELWAQLDKPLGPGTYQIKAAIDYGGQQLLGGILKATVKLPDTAPLDAGQVGARVAGADGNADKADKKQDVPVVPAQ